MRDEFDAPATLLPTLGGSPLPVMEPYMSMPRWTLAASLVSLAACSGERSSTSAVTGVESAAQTVSLDVFPELIALPNGFQPEGIASGEGTTIFVGSLFNGAIWRGDARTGAGVVLAEDPARPVVVGLKYEARGNRLFAAGGPGGRGYVLDATTGATLTTYQLSHAAGFINDVVVTNAGAYFTNSFSGEIHYVPFGPGGALPEPGAVRTIQLSGDFAVTAGFNLNGIDATSDGSALVTVQSNTGALFRVDPQTGEARRIDLGGALLTAGDGLLLEGFTLYVVQNRLNQVAVVRLSPDLTSGTVERTITDADFRVPTTVARIGGGLYLPNARFGTPASLATEYEVVRVSR